MAEGFGERHARDVLAAGNAPWLRGVLVENVRCNANVDTMVPHKLGRKPRGFFIVCSKTAPGPDIGRDAADLTAIDLSPSRAKLRLVTTGTSPRILSLWFW